MIARPLAFLLLSALAAAPALAATVERLPANSSRAVAKIDGNVMRFTAAAGAARAQPVADRARAGDVLRMDARGRIAPPAAGRSFGWRN